VNGNLPIHDALCDEATGPELVRAMLDAGGEAMLGVPDDNYKYLPLHCAAQYSRSPAVVEILLARGPAGALRAKDKWRRTPLYYAEHNTGPAAAEIKALLRAAMGASEEELRAAQAAQATQAQLLGRLELPAGAPVGEVRAALNKKNRDGNLPIHRALCDPATGPELVRAMVDAGGEAMLAVPGFCKALPLHYAAEYSRSPAVVEILLARGPPGAARAEDGQGRTPLWCAEEYNKGPAAAEIKALLRAAMG
jgi:hypothetical protein